MQKKCTGKAVCIKAKHSHCITRVLRMLSQGTKLWKPTWQLLAASARPLSLLGGQNIAYGKQIKVGCKVTTQLTQRKKKRKNIS